MEDIQTPPLTPMNHDLFRAAVHDSYFVNQTTPTKNTIVHIAAEVGHVDFITQALGRFPELVRQKNEGGDTALHVAARDGNEDTVKVLLSYHGCAIKEEAKEEECWAWIARNLEGDTPLHVALCCNNLSVAMVLLEVGSIKGLGLVSKKKETPLHAFLRYCTDMSSLILN